MNKKNKSLIVLLLVLCVGLVGLTVAYFSNSTTIDNLFSTKEYGTTYIEEFISPDSWLPGDTTNKTLTVTNSGQVEEVVRISYSEKWESSNNDELSGWVDENGNLSAHANNEVSDERVALINWTNEAEWIKDGDYYYYNYKLKPGETTSTFLDSVTFNPLVNSSQKCTTTETSTGKTITCSSKGDGYDEATYTLTFNVETTQFEGYKDAWNNPNVEITLSKSDTTVIKGLPVNAAIAQYDDQTKGNLFVFPHDSTEQTPAMIDYRYIGANPNNYVYFNCSSLENQSASICETWRIVGIYSVDDGSGNYQQRIKITRGSDFESKMAWDTGGVNDWSNSSLNAFLNGDYYNKENTASTYGLTSTARSMIGNAKYYLGGTLYDSVTQYGTAEDIYKWERGKLVYNNNPFFWIGTVGLMYADENSYLYIYSEGSLDKTNGWIFNSDIMDNDTDVTKTWLISTGAAGPLFTFNVPGPNAMTSDSNYAYYENGVRPAVYLNSNVEIDTGNGSSTNPYTLKVVSS